MTGLSSSGFDRKRLVDIITDIEDRLKASPLFGPNIDLDPESGFGQIIGVFADPVNNEWEGQENTYNAMYPSTAQKVQLSNVVQFNGLNRKEESFSTIADVVLSGVSSTPIPIGSQVSVDLVGTAFKTDSAVVIGVGGTVLVDVTAIEAGPKVADIGTLTVIDTPVFGWTGVSNTNVAIPGEFEETDPDLRIRRSSSVSASGQNLVDSLYGQLLNLDSVVDVVVLDNKTEVTDADGIPPHNFLSVILGGDADEIAATIWNNNPQGILSYGNATTSITDSQGFSQDMNYSRPSAVPIYFIVNLTVDGNYPIDGDDQIKAAIVDYGTSNFFISDDVIYNQFFTPINTIPGITTAEFFIGIASSPTGQINIPIAVEQYSTYTIGNVTVNS